MANYQLGSAFISIFPQMKGFRKGVAKEMGEAGREGTRGLSRFLDGSAKSIGSGFGSKLKGTFDKSVGSLGKAATASLEANARKAQSALQTANRKLADDIGRQRIAQTQLDEARDKYAAGSSQVIRAEERLAAAERKVQAAMVAQDAAARKATATQTALNSAMRAGEGSARSVSQVFATVGKSVSSSLSKLPGVSNEVAGKIGGSFTKAGASLSTWATGVKTKATAAFKALPGPAQTAVAGIGKAFSGVATSVGRMASSLPGAVAGGLSSLKSTFSDAFGFIGSAAAAAGTAVAGGLASVVKGAVGAFAQNEQLVGGVETMFKGAADVVKKNADEAFRSAGMSANAYMDNVMGFSASLISSLGGDTEKAAGLADLAIRDMSDNANKMGNDIQGIQNAYQSFAKGQFGLLDNLRIGYGGSEEEMERLLRNAETLTGKKFDLSNFADIVEAVHAIQDEWAITGTTALEGATTVEGSMNQMAAAWENFKTNLGTGERVDAAMQNLTSSITTYLSNLGPVVKQVGASLVGLLGDGIREHLPALGSVFDSIGSSLGGRDWSGIFGNLTPVIGGLVGALGPLLSRLPLVGSLFARLTGPVGLLIGLFVQMWSKSETLRNAVAGIGTALSGPLSNAFSALGGIFQQVSGAVGQVARALGDALGNAIAALTPILPVIVNALTQIVGLLAGTFSSVLTSLVPIIGSIGQTIANLAGAVLPVVIGVIQTIIPILMQVVQAILPIIRQALAAIAPLIPMVAEAIGQVVAALAQVLPPIQQMLASILPPLIAVIKAVVPPIVSVVTTILSKLLPVFTQVIGFLAKVVAAVVSFAAKFVSFIVNAITRVVSFFSNFRANVSSVMASVRSTVSSALDGVIGFFRSLPGKIKSALAGAASWLVGVGRDMVNGLLNGIGNFASKVFSKLKGGIDSAIGSVKSFLGIGSPSRLVAAQIGVPIAQGVALGVDKATPEMLDDVADDLNRVAQLRVAVPVDWSRRARFPQATTGVAAGRLAGANTTNVYVQATDPASVAAVIEARERRALGV